MELQMQKSGKYLLREEQHSVCLNFNMYVQLNLWIEDSSFLFVIMFRLVDHLGYNLNYNYGDWILVDFRSVRTNVKKIPIYLS